MHINLNDTIKFKHHMFGALKHGYGKVVACDLEGGAVVVSLKFDNKQQEVHVPRRNIMRVL